MRLARFLAAGLILALSGCGIANAVVSGVVGASAGTSTANPIVGYAVAVGVHAGIDELQKYVARVRGRGEQDAIVGAVGQMAAGEVRDWRIVHDIPLFDDEHGQMLVTRTIDTPIVRCKEVLFTVDSGKPPHLTQARYVTSACDGTRGWRWAAAEPAVERWGYFQHISH